MTAQSAPARIRLLDWAPSPFCLKLRSILDYKGLPYERVPVLGPSLLELVRRSQVRKVPALELDGEMLVDSTDIAHALEARFPAPPILPPDARTRGHCHVLEDWADEALYFIGLYYQWLDPAGQPQVRQTFGRRPLGLAARLFYQRRIARQVRGQGTGRKTPRHVESDLRRELDALEGLLGTQAFLLGGEPLLCDFAVNAQLVYLSRPPGSAARLAERPRLLEYMARMKSLRPAAAGAS